MGVHLNLKNNYIQFIRAIFNNENVNYDYNNYQYFSENCKNRYDRIINEEIFLYNMEEIKSTSYIIDTLEATLWCLINTNNYNEAVIKAINLGDDTDTIGACVGALSGIYYGMDSINKEWKKDLLKVEYLEELCEKFDKMIGLK